MWINGNVATDAQYPQCCWPGMLCWINAFKCRRSSLIRYCVGVVCRYIQQQNKLPDNNFSFSNGGASIFDVHTCIMSVCKAWWQHKTEVNNSHADVIKWKPFPRYWSFLRGIHRRPLNSPHKGQWCRALMFPLICAWTKAWVNNRDADDLRRHHAYYDNMIHWRYHSTV